MHSLWMVAASLLFACMGVCVKLGAAQFSAGELVFYRGFVSLLLLGLFVAWRRLPLATPHFAVHLRRSLAGFVALVCYFYALTLIPLATAVTLGYTSPLFLALLLALLGKEPVAPRLHTALAAGFLGVVLVLRPTLGEQQLVGGLIGLCSGVAASFAYLNVRRLGELGEPEWRVVFYFSLLTTLGGLPWLLASEPFHAIDARGWLLLLGVGGFGTLAQWCMTMAYTRGRTLASASLAYSTIVFASLFGIVLWDETLPVVAWAGIALITAAGLAATLAARPRQPAAAEL